LRVQTKITLLLTVLVATFVLGLFTFRAFDRAKLRRIAQERFDERRHSFSEFLEHNGATLKALVEDYTCWDQMVRALTNDDSHWLNENVNRSTLDSFHIQGIWIFHAEGSAALPVSYPDFPDLKEFPIAPEELRTMFSSGPFTHFFINTAHGLMELRGGTIHPSHDFARRTRPSGYFFAGRLWNQPTLDEMSMFTGDRIRLAQPTEVARPVGADEYSGTVEFTWPLQGWDKQPIAQLIIRNESPVVEQLNRRSDSFLACLIGFALVLLFAVSMSLWRWMRQPLRRLMNSLERNDPRLIEPMCNDNSEFGELARTLRAFFSQRDNLIREMEERRAAEEALRKKEDELRQSQKMEAIGRLAGGIAHDFNNLLTAIIGYADLIGVRPDQDAMVKHSALEIRRAGDQAANLTRQLLAFSRKQLLQPKVLDLNHLVAEMDTLLRRVIGEHFNLQTRLEASDSRVKADPSQLEQVTLNLCVNARDAMPNGGIVSIRTRNHQLNGDGGAEKNLRSLGQGEYVVLSVSDTGSGMSDETMAHIFEPFFTTKGPGKGTGLGLATVYGIVRQSGGAIEVESKLGCGTTFRIYLPREHAPVEMSRSPLTHHPIAGGCETVLVVDDDAAVRQLVCDVLEEHGYTVLCAKHGPEAIRLAEQHPTEIDLLVTDIIMPHMNGPELAGRLSLARPEMKVLYVSGYSADDIGDHGVLHEDVEYLQKPFRPHVFLQRVAEILANQPDIVDEKSQPQLQFAL
jgi:signal transduction histidine kinase/ActR/RegA family two-component response regulator